MAGGSTPMIAIVCSPEGESESRAGGLDGANNRWEG